MHQEAELKKKQAEEEEEKAEEERKAKEAELRSMEDGSSDSRAVEPKQVAVKRKKREVDSIELRDSWVSFICWLVLEEAI